MCRDTLTKIGDRTLRRCVLRACRLLHPRKYAVKCEPGCRECVTDSRRGWCQIRVPPDMRLTAVVTG